MRKNEQKCVKCGKMHKNAVYIFWDLEKSPVCLDCGQGKKLPNQVKIQQKKQITSCGPFPRKLVQMTF
jgi:hypothetical protein